MNEEWKPIEGYEGLYEVSNLGRVRSVARVVKGKGDCQRELKSRLLAPKNITNGYQQVTLSKDGKPTIRLLHRLVAVAFVPNPDNLNIVNHKDENPANNRADNLEWCTQLYNVNYGTGKERGNAKSNHNRRAVLQCDLEGNVLREFPSIKMAGKITGVMFTNIYMCCRGKYRHKTAGGYKWRYKE